MWAFVALTIAFLLTARARGQEFTDSELVADCERIGFDGLFVNPYDRCSLLYIECTGSNAILRRCADPSTVFDEQCGFCRSSAFVLDCPDGVATPCQAEPEEVDFDCTGRPTGKYPDPVNACSNRFFVCVAGTAHKFDCAGAATRFDTDSGDCLFPQFVLACGGTPTTRAPTPPPASTVRPDFDCAYKDDGFFPNPREPCDDSFFSCVGGVPFEFKCASPVLRFDVESGDCVFPLYVRACGGTPTTRAPTVAPSPPNEPSFDCSAKIDGNYANPLEPCDDTYFSCSGGHATEFHCASADSRFDVVSNACLFPNFVEACGGSTTTRAPTTPPAPTAPRPIISCVNRPLGNFADPQMPCSQLFFSCSGGENATPLQCSQNTFYDAEFDLCDYFENIPDCSGEERPTTQPTTPRPPTTPGRAFDCANLLPGNYGDPDAACSNAYFVCVPGGISVESHCPLGTFYSVDDDRCVFARDLAACQHDDPTPAEPQPEFDCGGLPDGNYPSLTKPCYNHFFQCFGGSLFRVECATTDLRYSAPEDACLLPQTVPGCPEYQGDNPCAGRENGFYPDLDDCARFLVCVAQRGVYFFCPSGSVYDDRVKRCAAIATVPPPCGTAGRPNPFSCVGLGDGFFGDPTSCNMFYRCRAGVLDSFSCKSGLAFSETTGKCEQAALVDGCMPAPDVDLADVCTATGIAGIFSMPGDCTRAVFCTRELIPFVLTCGNSSAAPFFNAVTGLCDANDTGCSS